MKQQPLQTKPYLLTHSLMPENHETPISFIDTLFVPNKYFYRRNHFGYPALSYSSYWLPIGGFVETPTVFSFQDLIQLPAKTLQVALECSGNKRDFSGQRCMVSNGNAAPSAKANGKVFRFGHCWKKPD